MSISQIFILSRRGDSIIYRDFRVDMKKSNDVFFRNVNFFEQEDVAPPIFNVDGINFIYIRTEDLYIAIATLDNAPPNYYLEVMSRLLVVIKDHIGELTEEAIRKNFVLVYEIIDEMIDFGYPQLLDTEQVKQFVYTEPQVDLKNVNTVREFLNPNIKSNDSTKQSIAVDKTKNEIYVDVIEKITCLFSGNGTIISSGIDGCIKMKSYLKKSPELKVTLNDEFNFAGTSYGGGKMEIYGYNFCREARAKNFEKDRVIDIIPPEGEFTLMNYRINSEFSPPFKIYTIIEEKDYVLDMRIKLLANFVSDLYAGNITLSFNTPLDVQSIYFELSDKAKKNQKTDFDYNQRKCYWIITKMTGGSEQILNIKFTLQNKNTSESRKKLGPIVMTFEIPNHSVSNLKIKEINIYSNDPKYDAKKWIRVYTLAKSYVSRIS